MEIRKIVDYVNRAFIASDYLREPDVYYYMDLVIDDINERLQANFPTFTDWHDFVAEWNAYAGPQDKPNDNHHGPEIPQHPHIHPDFPHQIHPGLVEGPFKHTHDFKVRSNTNYDAFPDTYIRSVVALGTAVKFYTRDEEGEQIALDYQNRYEMALFKMQRDYMNQVPWYFQDNTGGYIDFTYDEERGPRDLHPRGVVMRGNNTKGL